MLKDVQIYIFLVLIIIKSYFLPLIFTHTPIVSTVISFIHMKLYLTSTPLRPPKRCITPKKMLVLFPHFLKRVDMWEMWEFSPQAPALFVTKMHFARKITSCVRRHALPDISGVRDVCALKTISAIKVLLLDWVLQRGILIKSHCSLCSQTRSHQDDKCCWLLPGMKPGRSMKGVTWGKNRWRDARKILHMLLYLQWCISQHLRNLWGGGGTK